MKALVKFYGPVLDKATNLKKLFNPGDEVDPECIKGHEEMLIRRGYVEAPKKEKKAVKKKPATKKKEGTPAGAKK